ncbi:glutathione S-transferase family protein [Hydrogenophaga sp.]|uniref:glutathione S-transferase family protein n=1 Tax=Hydrogenophaga sp. TaxID=1904254 RepID=UPI0027182B5C|nr:glutathione S-transferase family protein [Hydrogenophaga sp.]MDO8903567.1 glutathione S-transferase family protein [Hydrogenophaga sp.]
MKLFVASRAPNPRRVLMFLVEKNINGLDLVQVDLNVQEHKTETYRAKSPLSKVPALELDDGRVLTESRAICTYMESLHPAPNLMGVDAEERAFIEMADRRMEFHLMLPAANCIRHTHPGLAVLEQPQFPDFGQSQISKFMESAAWLDSELQRQPWVAGERFTIADITAFCTIEFARLMRFKPADAGLHALQTWRDRVAERPSSRA